VPLQHAELVCRDACRRFCAVHRFHHALPRFAVTKRAFSIDLISAGDVITPPAVISDAVDKRRRFVRAFVCLCEGCHRVMFAPSFPMFEFAGFIYMDFSKMCAHAGVLERFVISVWRSPTHICVPQPLIHYWLRGTREAHAQFPANIYRQVCYTMSRYRPPSTDISIMPIYRHRRRLRRAITCCHLFGLTRSAMEPQARAMPV